jgi:hypothetical protein
LGNVLHGLLLDEDGAEGFILAVHGVGGLEEEGAVTRIVHDLVSGCGVICQDQRQRSAL